MPKSLAQDSEYLSLRDACRLIPGRPHFSTIFRWCQKGTNGHRLKSILIGNRRFIHRDSIAEFIQAINSQSPVSQVPVAKETPKQKQRRHDRVNRELDAMGL